jgi:hypothetical protein
VFTLVKAQYLGTGVYDLWVEEKDDEGAVVGRYQPRYIDLYSDMSGQVRFSLDKSCELPVGLAMGEYVTCEGDSKNASKAVNTRVVASVKTTVRSVIRQGVANGAVETDAEALAAA